MSQSDGSYKNIDTGIVGYFHSVSAADLNRKGYADIVVTDGHVYPQPYFLINNGDGTFTPDYTKIPASTLPYYFPGFSPVTPYAMPNYETELIDFNGDGKYDLFLGGNEVGHIGCTEWVFCTFQSSIYLNNNTEVDPTFRTAV